MIYELIMQGLNGDDDFAKTYERKLENLLEKAPSDASACSSICKENSGYSGSINICSSERRFDAKAFGKSPQEIAKNLFSEIQRQLKEWNHNRSLATA